ncbi:hypothetical protein [Salinisphaera dokdonensis]
MGSKQKSQQKLPRQSLKGIKDAERGKKRPKNQSKYGFHGYR